MIILKGQTCAQPHTSRTRRGNTPQHTALKGSGLPQVSWSRACGFARNAAAATRGDRGPGVRAAFCAPPGPPPRSHRAGPRDAATSSFPLSRVGLAVLTQPASEDSVDTARGHGHTSPMAGRARFSLLPASDSAAPIPRGALGCRERASVSSRGAPAFPPLPGAVRPSEQRGGRQ